MWCAGIVGAIGLFTGYINDLTEWFKAHPEIMIPALIVHFALYVIYWRVNSDLREVRRRGRKR